MTARALARLRLGRPLTGALLALLLGATVPTRAHAQAGAAQATVTASATKAEVGEPFTIELKASGEQTTPNSPDLQVPAGLSVVGQSSVQTGTRFKRSAIISWTLVGQKPGRYTIPGPTIVVNQARVTTRPIVIEIVKATAGGNAQRQGLMSPFLIPGGSGFRIQFGDDPEDALDGLDTPTLAMAAAPEPWIFLRAVPDKKTAVVGEQVTLAFYMYYRPGLEARKEESHDAPLADFRRFSLVTNPGADGEQRAKVGGELWRVQLLDRVAIFPLRAGELHTGSVTIKFLSRRLGQNNQRASDDQVITVTEPPKENRPPGYVFGDVGQFSLAASVVPRQIEQGGAVSVSVKVSGSGNFPQELHLPERTGLEWLDPEKRDAIGVQNGAITGSRSFGYVVRVKESGKVDLGTITLAYWNPANRRYEQTLAPLGVVDVGAAPPGPRVNDPSGKDPDPVEQAAGDSLGGLGAPRRVLGAYTAARAPLWGTGKSLWFSIAAPPLLVGLGFLGAGAARSLRSRRAASKDSPAALAAAAMREAEQAEGKGDSKAMASAVERALHLGIEASTGLKSRGVLLADLPGELDERGVAEEVTRAILDAFAVCETVRFDPQGEGARDLLAHARRALRDLSRSAPS